MKRYITTPIYYVNDVPHIGHAYTTVAADVLSRYYKLNGEEVFLLTGTDEHGAKIAAAASKAGKSPKEYADELAVKFQSSWKNLNIDYSQFFRTTDPKHEEIVKEFVKKLAEKGYVEKREYEGLYCVGCEKYLTKNDLVDGKCPDHKAEPIKQSEENYFFLLSKFQNKLIEVIEKDELIISPKYRKNEILGKLRLGLDDVSISRENVEWGISFPGDQSQTIYVWVDALINYYSATHMYEDLEIWEDHPADIHLMAKDILWFHSIIWPAMLLALDLPLPKQVFAHGFFTIAGEKMSKTIGNVLDPNVLVGKYGADALRYALLREFPFGEDGDISEEKISARYQSELSNGLGNLVQRTISMIKKYEVDCHPELVSGSRGIPKQVRNDKIGRLIEELKFDQALAQINNEVTKLNQYIEENKPWELAKSDQEKLAEVLDYVYQGLVDIAPQISPFMPQTAEKIKNQLNTLEPEQLFPRLEE